MEKKFLVIRNESDERVLNELFKDGWNIKSWNIVNNESQFLLEKPTSHNVAETIATPVSDEVNEVTIELGDDPAAFIAEFNEYAVNREFRVYKVTLNNLQLKKVTLRRQLKQSKLHLLSIPFTVDGSTIWCGSSWFAGDRRFTGESYIEDSINVHLDSGFKLKNILYDDGVMEFIKEDRGN